jgi:hypothetical protein
MTNKQSARITPRAISIRVTQLLRRILRARFNLVKKVLHFLVRGCHRIADASGPKKVSRAHDLDSRATERVLCVAVAIPNGGVDGLA